NPSRSILSSEGLSLRDKWRVRWTGCDSPQSNLISGWLYLDNESDLDGIPIYRFSRTASGFPGPFAFLDGGESESSFFRCNPTSRKGSEKWGTRHGLVSQALVKEVLPVQRIPLRGAESRIADDPTQFLFRSAVRHAGGAHYVFFQHHGANVVAAEAQAHLADFEALRDPTGLHVEEVRQIQARDGQHFQVFDSGGFVPVPAAESRVVRLK